MSSRRRIASASASVVATSSRRSRLLPLGARRPAAGPWRSRTRASRRARSGSGCARRRARRGRAAPAGASFAGMRRSKSPPEESSPVETDELSTKPPCRFVTAVTWSATRCHLVDGRLELQREGALDLAVAAPGREAAIRRREHDAADWPRRRRRGAWALRPARPAPPSRPRAAASAALSATLAAPRTTRRESSLGEPDSPPRSHRDHQRRRTATMRERAAGCRSGCHHGASSRALREALLHRLSSHSLYSARGLRRVGPQHQRQLLELARQRVVVGRHAGVEGVVDRGEHVSCVMAGLSQLRDGAVQAGAHVRLRHPEHAGDLAVREPARELQRDQVALLAVERRERGADGLAPQRQLRVVLRRRRVACPRDRPRASRAACACAARPARRSARCRTPRRPSSRARAGSSAACGTRARTPARSRPRPPSGRAAATPRRRRRAGRSARTARQSPRTAPRRAAARSRRTLRSRPNYARASYSSRIPVSHAQVKPRLARCTTRSATTCRPHGSDCLRRIPLRGADRCCRLRASARCGRRRPQLPPGVVVAEHPKLAGRRGPGRRGGLAGCGARELESLGRRQRRASVLGDRQHLRHEELAERARRPHQRAGQRLGRAHLRPLHRAVVERREAGVAHGRGQRRDRLGALGNADMASRQAGWTFRFVQPPEGTTYVMRGVVELQWRGTRGGREARHASDARRAGPQAAPRAQQRTSPPARPPCAAHRRRAASARCSRRRA